MNTNNQELKPCPFCGSKNVEIFEPVNKNENVVGRAVMCYECGTRAGFPLAYDDLIAAKEWNRRAKNER